jgi:hypothetical protein
LDGSRAVFWIEGHEGGAFDAHVPLPTAGTSAAAALAPVLGSRRVGVLSHAGDGAGRDGEAEGVHGGGVAVALGELVCLDHDRDLPG